MLDTSGISGKVPNVTGILLVVGWYFAAGKGQVSYVKETLGGQYVKRSWAKPLLIAVGLVVVYLAVLFGAGLAFTSRSPQAVADMVKPMILEEWHKKPELKDATIQNVTLTRKEGDLYTGFVDATFSDGPHRFGLEVTNNLTTIQWKTRLADKE